MTGWPQRGKSWHFAFPVCSEISGASVDCSTSKNIARTYVDVSQLLFLGSKEFYHRMFPVMHITDQLH